MPIYQYLCKDCGERFDCMRPMKDSDAPINCQHCNSQHTQKVPSKVFSHTAGRTYSSQSSSSGGGCGGGCGGCSGGSCSSCSH